MRHAKECRVKLKTKSNKGHIIGNKMKERLHQKILRKKREELHSQEKFLIIRKRSLEFRGNRLLEDLKLTMNRDYLILIKKLRRERRFSTLMKIWKKIKGKLAKMMFIWYSEMYWRK